MEKEEIKINSYYQHCNGTIYKVLGISICSDTKKRLVLYKEDDGYCMWSRPESEFFELVYKPDSAIMTKRFELL